MGKAEVREPTEMERIVAAALWNTHLRRWRDPRALAKGTPDEFLEYARAAIRAMREPTPDMKDAGAIPNLDISPEVAACVWPRMIYAASPE